MKIYLGSADLDDIRWATDAGLIDGIVTSPGLLADARADEEVRGLLTDVVHACRRPVLVTVARVDAHEAYREAREIAKLSDLIVVDLPLVEDTIQALHRLSTEGIRVATSGVFTPAQAILAAKAGASLVIAPLDQLDLAGHEGADVLGEIRRVFDLHGMECEAVAATVSTSAQVTACALAGCDAVVVASAVLRALLLHPLTDRAVDRLLHDVSKHPRARLSP
ncbi:MAG: fructose-6-phosphate aldolase [Gemmatimonadaceae bacterium]